MMDWKLEPLEPQMMLYKDEDGRACYLPLGSVAAVGRTSDTGDVLRLLTDAGENGTTATDIARALDKRTETVRSILQSLADEKQAYPITQKGEGRGRPKIVWVIGYPDRHQEVTVRSVEDLLAPPSEPAPPPETDPWDE